MREFIKIAANLFVICLISASILGLVFMGTEHARKRNERLRMETSMARYIPGGTEGIRFVNVYRYLIEGGDAGELGDLGYVVPGEDGPLLMLLSPSGEMKGVKQLESANGLSDAGEREAALRRVLAKDATATFTDNYILAMRGHERVASFIRGRTQGFKTWVNMLVALDTGGAVAGLEIFEHEEDPGLGGEIETEYFRNQFRDRSPDELKKLTVVKLPLSREYRQCLERSRWKKLGLSAEAGEALCQSVAGEAGEIHAITGATISTQRVTDGVKRLVNAFSVRMAMVEKAARGANLAVPF